jgi:hypothetical protein
VALDYRGDLALSLLAEEAAEKYRRMASRYSREYPRKAGLLRLASTLLDLLAGELAAGRPSPSTLERLESLERLLRWSGLPWQYMDRVRRMAVQRLERGILAGLEIPGGEGLPGVGWAAGALGAPAVGELEY